tara:strand:+ start:1938 stop:2069 length:132 start_codon:yes stop_codon:yes gene_type:complete
VAAAVTAAAEQQQQQQQEQQQGKLQRAHRCDERAQRRRRDSEQ